MLSLSDTQIEPFLQFFTRETVPVSFLVPTPTGYEKSIMDAIGALRDMFQAEAIHDYDKQGKGTTNKVVVSAYFVYGKSVEKTAASLYRPETKNGDPRIWFYGLKKYCKPCNLLAIVPHKKQLYVFNLSNQEVRDSLNEGGFALELMRRFSSENSSVANELMEKLRIIHKRGFIKSVGYGDTCVGMTLEHALGIKPNSSKDPDYKGIELKASRVNDKGKSSNRANLFSQAPDWKNSKGHNDRYILDKYGYYDKKKRFNLNCTVSCKPNQQGLFFEIEQENLINYAQKNGFAKEYVVQWSLKKFKSTLLKKHRETFWVKAEPKVDGGVEFFRYDHVVHTMAPNVTIVPYLFEHGIITMDYTLHFKEDNSVREHGYLFKLKSNKIDMLFPEPKLYYL